MKKIPASRLVFLILCIIVIAYGSGPKPVKPNYDLKNLQILPNDFYALENLIENQEKGLNLKLNSKARVHWNDTLKQKTRYSIVYLHGFSATAHEGNPAHFHAAKHLNANMYLARLSDHGIISENELLNFTAEQAWEDAKQALAIGQALGEEVILMGTSTGATLALMLAAHFDVKAVICLSPNIEINDPTAFLLNNPWGLEIAKMVLGGDHRSYEASDSAKLFWHTRYRIESLVQLQQLIEDHMKNETFDKIKAPLYVGCYYKDEQNQDNVVRVSAMREMFSAVKTPENLKQFVEFPDAGDHVIASTIKSKSTQDVLNSIVEFLEKIKAES